MEVPAHLSNQDAHHHTELVEGAEGPPEGRGRHLANVHGGQAGEEAAEQADDQAPSNHHLIRGADGGEAHEEAADHRQAVHQEHGATPEEGEGGLGETRNESIGFLYSFSEFLGRH